MSYEFRETFITSPHLPEAEAQHESTTGDQTQTHHRPHLSSSDGGASYAQPQSSSSPCRRSEDYALSMPAAALHAGSRRLSMPPSSPSEITSLSSTSTNTILDHGLSIVSPISSPRAPHGLPPQSEPPSKSGGSRNVSFHLRQPSAEAPPFILTRSSSAQRDSLSIHTREIHTWDPSEPSEATSTLQASQYQLGRNIDPADPTDGATSTHVENQASGRPPLPSHIHTSLSIPYIARVSINAPSGSGTPIAPTMAAPESMQGFRDYLRAEARAQEKLPTADIVWGQTERERVYNFLIFVPYQLERLIEFSFMLCFDCVLGVVTMLPLRCCLAMRTMAANLKKHDPKQDEGHKAKQEEGLQSTSSGLSGGQLFDLLCLLILVSATVSLRFIPPGFIYYWLKDIIVNEFLKMSVLTAALEIAERIVGNFGLDVMEALSGTCTLWAMGRVRGLHLLVCDTVVAFLVVLLHAIILMCEALVLAMTLNSKKNGLLGFLIATNFVEIKSNVFKHWNVERIRKLVWGDVVERFQLLCILTFVVIEDMDSGATWVPSLVLLGDSLRILGAEIVIDITKHAVLGKFNDVRPGIYKEYMKDLCDKVTASQSHNLHKLLGFHHMACCTLLLRSAVKLFWLQLEPTNWQVMARALLFLGIWIVLVLFKLPFGYALKWVAHRYTESYNNAHLGKVHPRSAVSATMGGGRGSTGVGSSRRETPRGEPLSLLDPNHPSRQKQD